MVHILYKVENDYLVVHAVYKKETKAQKMAIHLKNKFNIIAYVESHVVRK